MAEDKTELITRIKAVQDTNDQKSCKHIEKIDHIEKVVDKIEEDIKQENKDIGKKVHELSTRLTPKIDKIEEYIKDEFENTISEVIKNKPERVEIKFIEDMIKVTIEAKIEDNINNKISDIIEDKLQDVKSQYMDMLTLVYDNNGRHRGEIQEHQERAHSLT